MKAKKRPYSFFKMMWGSSYTCLTGIQALGKFVETGPKYPQLMCWDTKNNPNSSAPHFPSNKTLLLCQDHLRIELYLLYGYLGVREIWRNWAHIYTQIMYRDTQKVIQSLQLHISHQARLFVGQILPVSQVLWYWDNSGKLCLNTSNHVQGYRKSNPKFSAPYFT